MLQTASFSCSIVSRALRNSAVEVQTLLTQDHYYSHVCCVSVYVLSRLHTYFGLGTLQAC